MKKVVEVPDVRQADARGLQRRLHSARPVLVEGPAQVQRVRNRIQHRLGRHVRLCGMERCGQLDVAGAKLAGEREPFFNRAIRIGIAHLARRQLLQRRREDTDLHELWFERFDRHANS